MFFLYYIDNCVIILYTDIFFTITFRWMTRHAELWSEFVEIISIKPNDSPTQMGEFVVNFVMYKAGY